MMDNAFLPMTEEYRQRNYPNGYFEALAKSGGSGGVILIICGAVLALMGLLFGYMEVQFLIEFLRGETYGGAEGFLIVMGIVTLLFLLGGLFFILLGWKRSKMGAGAWLKKSAEASGYQESVIRDFANQVTSSDTIRLQIAGGANPPMGIGFLTRDYILFENILKLCVIKVSDISGAYLVSLPDLSARHNICKIHIAIFSNRKTFTTTQCLKENGERLISMLAERNPEIDTAGCRILSEKEYNSMIKNS